MSRAPALHEIRRPFRSTERHPLITISRDAMSRRAQEAEHAASRLAVLFRTDPENDVEIDRWAKVFDDATKEMTRLFMRDRQFRDMEGMA